MYFTFDAWFYLCTLLLCCIFINDTDRRSECVYCVLLMTCNYYTWMSKSSSAPPRCLLFIELPPEEMYTSCPINAPVSILLTEQALCCLLLLLLLLADVTQLPLSHATVTWRAGGRYGGQTRADAMTTTIIPPLPLSTTQ